MVLMRLSRDHTVFDTWDPTPPMTDLDQLNARLANALDRIAAGLTHNAPAPDAAADALRADLAREKATNSQLNERLRAAKDRDGQTAGALQVKVDAMTRQLDVQGLEMQRLRKTTSQLRDQLRVVIEAARDGTVDAAMINKALLAELEAMRAIRASEEAEIEDILSELAPLILEVTDARP